MSRSFAQGTGLVDADGLPWGLSGRSLRFIESNGIVIGATEQHVVVPAVTYSIGGIEITSDVSVPTSDQVNIGIWAHMDVLVSMNDIYKLEARGAAFRPTGLS
jgi:hypothetical protein